jgi:multiple antibiotic resistance protein
LGETERVNTALLGQVLVTLMVIMDPPGAVPVFLAVTSGLDPVERRRAALLAVATAFSVIVLFAVGGRQVLTYLHVTVPALRVSGGLLLLLVSLQLLQGGEAQRHSEVDELRRTSIGMVPLGTPLLAGPGAIVATIVFVERCHHVGDWVALMLGIAGVHVVLFLAMRFSAVVLRVIRETGVLLVTRVAGMLLAAIAVQMVADGVRSLVQQG